MEPNPSPQVNPQALSLISRISDEITKNKPGWQTTEFYLVGLIVAALMLFAASGHMAKTQAGLVTGAISIGYAWLRGNRKNDREVSLLTLIDTIATAAPSLVAVFAPSTPSAPRAEGLPTTDATKLPAIVYNDVPPGSAAGVGPQSGFARIPLLGVLCALGASLLIGCATLAKWQADPRVQFAEQEALKIVVAGLDKYSNGGNIDSAWGISEGIFAFSDTVNAINAKSQSQADANNALALQLAQTIQSYASTKDTKALAGKVSALITKANPQSDAQRVAIVNAIGTSFQSAAEIATPPSTGKAIVPPQAARSRRPASETLALRGVAVPAAIHPTFTLRHSPHPQPYVWPQPTPRFHTTPVALRPESRTLYDEADRPIPPFVRADGIRIVTRTND